MEMSNRTVADTSRGACWNPLNDIFLGVCSLLLGIAPLVIGTKFLALTDWRYGHLVISGTVVSQLYVCLVLPAFKNKPEVIYRVIWIELLACTAVASDSFNQILPSVGYWPLDLLMLLAVLFGIHTAVEMPFRLKADRARKGDAFALAKWLKARLANVALALFFDFGIFAAIHLIVLAQIPGWWIPAALVYLCGAFLWNSLQASRLQFLTHGRRTLHQLCPILEDLVYKSELKPLHCFMYDRSHVHGDSQGYCYTVGKINTIGLRDDFFKALSPEEQRYVFAHELGHAVAQDTVWTLIFNSIVAALGLFVLELLIVFAGISGWDFLSNIGKIPLLLLSVHLALHCARPFWKALSRAQERRADLYALTLAGNAVGMIRFFERFNRTECELESKAHPSLIERVFMRLTYLDRTHPSDKERLSMAKAWRDSKPAKA